MSEDWRTLPVYSVAQAARLAGVSTRTVKRWLYGQEAPAARMRPVFGDRQRPEAQPAEISFLQLIEIVVAARFRRRGVTLERLRRAHDYARKSLATEYPFASMKLKTDGVHVLKDFGDREPGAPLLVLDQYGQLTLPNLVAAALETFEFEAGLAARWFPQGRSFPIVVDPRFGTGMPTIPGRRLQIATIRDRWMAGDSIQFISEDFDLKPSEVEAVLRFAERYAA